MKIIATRIAAALLAGALGMGAIAATSVAEAREPAVYQANNWQAAVGGYDLTTYFSGTGVPTMGTAQFAAVHAGTTYWFVSAANRAAFLAAPNRYLPQYGGYCAWATSRGYLAPGRPQFYRVVNGKLYLNFDRGVQRRWEQDIPGFIARADAQWPAILG